MTLLRKLSRSRQIDFLKLWASLKIDGGTDRSIITSMLEDYRNVYGDCAEARFCTHTLGALQNWNGGLSEAMVGWFDDDLALLVRVCKRADNVERSLSKMLNDTEKWFKLKKDILIDVSINSLFIIFTIAIFSFICTVGLRYITEGQESTDINGVVQTLLAIGVFIENKWAVTCFLLVSTTIGLYLAAIYYVGEKRAAMDRIIPFYGFYLGNCSSKFFTMLDVLMSASDMSLRKALEEMQKSGLVNRYISSHIDEMLYRLKERKGGQSNADVADFDTLDTGLLPSRLRLRLKNISKSSDPDIKASTMKTISESLITEQGEYLKFKVNVIGRFIKLGASVITVLSLVILLDSLFVKFSVMQGMG